MLERIRQDRRLHVVLVTMFALAWLAALSAAVPARTALGGLPAADLCVGPQGSGGAWQTTPAGDSRQGDHHEPHCLLCLALGTPSAIVPTAGHPPAPTVEQACRPRAAPALAWQVRAPLPARGPPVRHHT